MKRILFILTLAATVLTGCKKDKFNYKESDLIGVWVHVESIIPGFYKTANAPFVLEFTKDHELISYSDGSYETFSWSIQGNQLLSSDKDGDRTAATINKLDGKHLTYSSAVDGGITETWINIEKLLPGEWTAQWKKQAHYVTFSEDGRSAWAMADTGQSAGTYSWSIHVNIDKSRAVIVFTGEKWNDTETVESASDEVVWVTNKDGGPGKYTRGKIENPGYLPE